MKTVAGPGVSGDRPTPNRKGLGVGGGVVRQNSFFRKTLLRVPPADLIYKIGYFQ